MVVYIVLKKIFLSFLVVWHRSISRIKSIFFFEESIELEVLDNIYRNMRTYSIWLKWLPSCCSEIDGIEDNFVSLISKESLTENLKSKLARFQHFWEIYIQIEEQTCKNILVMQIFSIKRNIQSTANAFSNVEWDGNSSVLFI